MSLDSQIQDFWIEEERFNRIVESIPLDNSKDRIKIENIVRKSNSVVSSNSSLSEFGLGEYSIFLVDNNDYFNLYRDTTFGFVLTKNTNIEPKKGLAILGFSFRRRGSILIEQIQGTKGLQIGRDIPLDWDFKFLRFSLSYFAQNDFDRIDMSPGERTTYYNRPVGIFGKNRIAVHQKRMYSRYDVNAIRAGFIYSNEEKVYKLNLVKGKNLSLK